MEIRGQIETLDIDDAGRVMINHHAPVSSDARWPRPAPRSTRGRDGLPPCLQDGAGRHRVEAEGLALPLGALARLAQDEEPERAGSDARSGGGLGPMTFLFATEPRISGEVLWHS
jgi:hypothetical protein